MTEDEAALELAGAILDGTSVDWGAVRRSAGETGCSLVEELECVAMLADFHRNQRAQSTPPPDMWGHIRVLEALGAGAFGRRAALGTLAAFAAFGTPLLFLFILFGIARAAFGHRRGWGHGYGPGYGRWGYGPGAWMGPGSPEAGSGTGSPRDQWVAEMHRRLHEAEGTANPSGANPSGANPSGTGPAGSSSGSGTPPAS